MTGHWAQHAPQWGLVGPPLRPCRADIGIFEKALRPPGCAISDALLLGVTPEIMQMKWPRGTDMVAVDRSPEMILHHGMDPAAGTARRVLCADWRALPLTAAAFDAALGDGSLNVLEGRQSLAEFTAELHRVLRPDGRLILRVFIRPDGAETLAALLEDLRAGQIGSFHAFKWRLAMCLHGTIDAGVRLADIWNCWHANVPAPENLLRLLGWDTNLLKTIDVYQGVQTRYTFPTRTELADIFAELFEEISYQTQDYELGARCPIIEWRRR